MKTKILTTATIICLGIAFQGCEKEDTIFTDQTPEKNESITSSKKKSKSLKSMPFNYDDLVNQANMYDQYSSDFDELYLKIKAEITLLLDINPSPSENDIKDLINRVSASFQGVQYPAISTSNYSDSEIIFLDDLFENATIQNLVSLSQFHENKVLNSQNLTNIQKNRLLSIISQFKFNLYFGSILVIDLLHNTKADNSTHFRVCLGNKAKNHFADDGSLVGEFKFIVGLPWSFGWDMVDCALHVANSSSGAFNPNE